MNYVYTIHDKASGCYYFGSTADYEKRIERHMCELERSKHHNVKMQKLYDSGAEFYSVFTLCKSREDAYELENDLIRSNRNDPKMLNIGTAAIGGDNLTYHPHRDIILERMSAALRCRYSTMDASERRLMHGKLGDKNGMYGRQHTDESKRKMSEKLKGKTPPNKGVPMSKDRYNQHLDSMANRDISGEKNGFYGKTHTKETRKRLSEIAKRRKSSRSINIIVNGIWYESPVAAGKVLNMSSNTIRWRCKSKNPKYKGYQFYKSPEYNESQPKDEKG